MRVTISTDRARVNRVLRRLFRDQVPFATSKALNETAKDAQKVQRQHQRRFFTVRRKRFVDRAVKIKPWARKSRLSVTVRIDPPGGADRADIITKFESGGVKTPRRGSRLAVPQDVRRTKSGVVSKTQRLSSLNFVDVSPNVAKGKKRTFLIRKPGGKGIVFQRRGRRGGSVDKVKVLFTFTPSVRIPGGLDFVQNVERTARRRLARNFEDAMDQAIRTAR